MNCSRHLFSSHYDIKQHWLPKCHQRFNSIEFNLNCLVFLQCALFQIKRKDKDKKKEFGSEGSLTCFGVRRVVLLLMVLMCWTYFGTYNGRHAGVWGGFFFSSYQIPNFRDEWPIKERAGRGNRGDQNRGWGQRARAETGGRGQTIQRVELAHKMEEGNGAQKPGRWRAKRGWKEMVTEEQKR